MLSTFHALLGRIATPKLATRAPFDSQPLTRFAASVSLYVVALLLLIWGLAIAFLVTDRSQTVEAARKEIFSLAAGLTWQTEAMLADGLSVGSAVLAGLESSGALEREDSAQIFSALGLELTGGEYVAGLFITTPAATYIAGRNGYRHVSPTPPVWQTPLIEDESDVLIGEPFAHPLWPEQRILPIAREYRSGARPILAGAWLHLDKLRERYAGLSISDGVFGLIGPNGRAFVRTAYGSMSNVPSPADYEPTEDDITTRRLLTAQPRIVVADSSAGAVKMMYGMSKPVASAPLITVVGRTWESIVAPLRVRSWIVLGVTGFATVLVLLLTVFLYHHVNELRRRDTQLQRINETLEQRVTERTFELEQANSHLATVNQELEAFTAAASHDLRSPLGVISGQAGMLGMELHSDTPPQQLERLNRILNAVRHASELIDGLLVLARITTQGMRSDAVNLSALVKDALTALQENDPERPVVCRIDEDAHITADARLMRSLITNLVNNAWKYSRDKERVEIEFRVERGAAGTTFRLSDRGAGFDMARAQDLFHPFKRLHSMLEFSGTGIGLAIVERIIRRYGGRIWAEAEVGAGATFFFTLPFAINSRVKEVDDAAA